MTQKELLYLEDAIGHETNLINIISSTISLLEDKNLISFMRKHLKKHQNLKQKLMQTMEDVINE